VEKTPLNAVPALPLRAAVKTAIDVEAIACANCKFVHMNPDLTYACWKAPPTAVAAWVQTRDGSMNLQVGGARSPVERDAWCGEFSRKTTA
jgi:hypothetical protein